jgi:V/A-type H+-transporting ATPase subunit E
MDAKLESLIEKIKKDGIEEAKRKAGGVLEAAKKEAGELIAEARAEARRITDAAAAEADKLKKNTEDSLRQASRDLVLALRSEITALFDRVFKKKAKEALSADFTRELIIKIVENWSKDKQVSLEVIVNQREKDKLKELVLAGLSQELKDAVAFKTSQDIAAGFRIGLKGANIYYDFTDETIAQALREFLNPSITAMLDKDNG